MSTDLLTAEKEFHAYTDYRDKLLELIDDGLLDARLAVLCLVKYMSQDDVKDCMKVNELLEEDE